jgi:hypothetical protein
MWEGLTKKGTKKLKKQKLVPRVPSPSVQASGSRGRGSLLRVYRPAALGEEVKKISYKPGPTGNRNRTLSFSRLPPAAPSAPTAPRPRPRPHRRRRRPAPSRTLPTHPNPNLPPPPTLLSSLPRISVHAARRRSGASARRSAASTARRGRGGGAGRGERVAGAARRRSTQSRSARADEHAGDPSLVSYLVAVDIP